MTDGEKLIRDVTKHVEQRLADLERPDTVQIIDTLTRAICAEFSYLDPVAVRGTIACALPSGLGCAASSATPRRLDEFHHFDSRLAKLHEGIPPTGTAVNYIRMSDRDETISFRPKESPSDAEFAAELARFVTPAAPTQEPPASPLDVQHGGDHYKKLGIYQPWQVAAAWLTPEELKGAAKKEAFTYLAREADKGGREDIEKACHTLQIYLELTKDGS